MQDAVNLGWKLAQVVKKTSPESLRDTYHTERHPVAATVLRNTMAQVALLRTDDRTNALRETMSELLGMDEPRRGDDVWSGRSLRLLVQEAEALRTTDARLSVQLIRKSKASP